jgi:hypothetical protein
MQVWRFAKDQFSAVATVSVWYVVWDYVRYCTRTRAWELIPSNNNYRLQSLNLLVAKYGVKGYLWKVTNYLHCQDRKLS